MIPFVELMQLSPMTFTVFLGVFSLSVGSFLNVLIYRLPLMLNAEWRADCCQLLALPAPDAPKVNLFYPRSFCPACQTTIPFWHNIPVLSYCLLLGRCHHCHANISCQYPLIELLCAGLSLFAAWQFGLHLTLLFALLFIWMLIPLFFIDLKHQILPDCITLSFLWLGLIANTQALFTPLPNAVFSAAGAYLSLWLFIRLFYWATGKIGMGNGDFKLFAAFGAWFGASILPFILISASLSGAIVGIAYLSHQKKSKETPIPFGPFLCISGLIALFYGERITHWYIQLLS
jgi:leader peptidase (prepilin peptidase)/N-methyltransferase